MSPKPVAAVEPRRNDKEKTKSGDLTDDAKPSTSISFGMRGTASSSESKHDSDTTAEHGTVGNGPFFFFWRGGGVKRLLVDHATIFLEYSSAD